MKCKTYHASQKMPYRLLYMANVITVNRTLNGDKMYYSLHTWQTGSSEYQQYLHDALFILEKNILPPHSHIKCKHLHTQPLCCSVLNGVENVWHVIQLHAVIQAHVISIHLSREYKHNVDVHICSQWVMWWESCDDQLGAKYRLHSLTMTFAEL